jgi:hypothetical protein
MKMLLGSGIPIISYTVSTNQDSGINIRTAVGSVTVPSMIVFTVNAGIRIKKVTTGTFPAGSKLQIINNGVIFGQGGNGGEGAAANTSGLGTAGSNGSDALEVTTASGLTVIEIQNVGYILGGGGGGAGGGSLYYPGSPVDKEAGGGGGGGMGGGTGGAGGSSGTYTTVAATAGQNGPLPTWTGSTWDWGGIFGGAYVDSGAWGIGTYPAAPAGPCTGVNGGYGGGYGTDGSYTNTAQSYIWPSGWPTWQTSGGTAGKAIQLNGNVTPTWLSGNNSAQVKGVVS